MRRPQPMRRRPQPRPANPPQAEAASAPRPPPQTGGVAPGTLNQGAPTLSPSSSPSGTSATVPQSAAPTTSMQSLPANGGSAGQMARDNMAAGNRPAAGMRQFLQNRRAQRAPTKKPMPPLNRATQGIAPNMGGTVGSQMPAPPLTQQATQQADPSRGIVAPADNAAGTSAFTTPMPGADAGLLQGNFPFRR